MGFRLKDTGSADRVVYANAAARNGATIRTISAWIYLDSTAGAGGIFSCGVAGHKILFYANAGGIALYKDNPGAGAGLMQRTSNTSTLSAATLTHVLATTDGNSTYTSAHLYKNGVEVTYADPGSSGGDADAYTGSIVVGNNDAATSSVALDGVAYDVAAWITILTADEILALARKISPALIRPEARFFYDRCIRTPYDEWGGQAGTGTNLVVDPHIGTFYPRRRRTGTTTTTGGAVDTDVDCGVGNIALGGLAASVLTASTVNTGVGNLSLAGLDAAITIASLAGFTIDVTFPTGTTMGTPEYEIRDIVAGAENVVTAWIGTGMVAAPGFTPSGTNPTQPPIYTINASVTGNSPDGSFAGIIQARAGTGGPYDTQELNLQADSAPGATVRITKLMNDLPTDTFITPGRRVYQNTSGSNTPLESHTTAGIVAVSNLTKGYMTDVVVAPASDGTFQGFIVWDEDAAILLVDKIHFRAAAGAVQQPAGTKTVTVTLVDAANAPRASLTGLKWAFFDQITPDIFATPVDQGTGESTDASGVLVITTHTALASGGTGWLVVTDSDGTTTQSPAHKAFAGPVLVA